MRVQGRTIGMWRYVLFHGLVFDVLTLAVGYALSQDLLSVRNALVLVLVGGPVYGYLTWLFRKREARLAPRSTSPRHESDVER